MGVGTLAPFGMTMAGHRLYLRTHVGLELRLSAHEIAVGRGLGVGLSSVARVIGHMTPHRSRR